MEEQQYNIIRKFFKKNAVQNSILLNSYFFNQSKDYEVNNINRLTQKNLLKSVFGYDTFRPLQNEIIDNVLQGRDTLAVMPTGGGKSLCYQLPALLMEGLTVVVSPLIALMQDQVQQLKSIGVDAVFLNSTLDWETYLAEKEKVISGKVKLLYVSPESLNTSKIQDILHHENICVNCITIDEAHCVSEWGHDFRPDYLEIGSIRHQFPKAVCLALTATATQQVRQDIIRILKLEFPAIFVASFNRPNIFLEVKKKNKPLEQVKKFLEEHPGERGIIYCFSRKQVDQLTDFLANENYNVMNYHAGLTDDVRSKNQEDFIKDRANIMVATLAFGMGINKPDIRFVIHFDMPKSIEQYYQEIGRAGRDGLPSHALMLYTYQDIAKIKYFFEDNSQNSKQEKLLYAMVEYAQSKDCRRKQLLSYFGEHPENIHNALAPENCCDICRNKALGIKNELVDSTLWVKKFISCIYRTGQKFGASYVSDVLMGSRAQRIIANRHHEISTWGIGKELKKNQWMELSDAMVQNELLVKDNNYGVVFISQKGWEAIRNQETVELPLSFVPGQKNPKEEKLKPKMSFKKADVFSQMDNESKALADKIRKWRRKFADELNLPPYIIFGDRTLADIVTKKPRTISELKDCHGIGEQKILNFGNELLQVINQ